MLHCKMYLSQIAKWICLKLLNLFLSNCKCISRPRNKVSCVNFHSPDDRLTLPPELTCRNVLWPFLLMNKVVQCPLSLISAFLCFRFQCTQGKNSFFILNINIRVMMRTRMISTLVMLLSGLWSIWAGAIRLASLAPLSIEICPNFGTWRFGQI